MVLAVLARYIGDFGTLFQVRPVQVRPEFSHSEQRLDDAYPAAQKTVKRSLPQIAAQSETLDFLERSAGGANGLGNVPQPPLAECGMGPVSVPCGVIRIG
jgi:hypothetical protein